MQTSRETCGEIAKPCRQNKMSCPGLTRLDPGIHPSSQERFSKMMDCRVKPGNDEVS
jgi:hypothetical protein